MVATATPARKRRSARFCRRAAVSRPAPTSAWTFFDSRLPLDDGAIIGDRWSLDLGVTSPMPSATAISQYRALAGGEKRRSV